MTDRHLMKWHAFAKTTGAPVQKSVLVAILTPVTLIGGFFAIANGYYHGLAIGLQTIVIVAGLSIGLFGFSWLVVLAISPKGIRTGFIMNDIGVYSYTDDEVAEQIITAGGALGAGGANPTMMSTPLLAKAGKAGQCEWSNIDGVIEKPSQNYFDLRKG